MSRVIRILLNIVYSLTRNNYYGFIQGHDYLKRKELLRIKKNVGVNDHEIVNEFETAFARLIGSGYAVSYAAGRMGFYDLMRIQNIGHGDEVILLGATCAVMANAVIRIGAIPIYADIDLDTYGSSAGYIESVITPATKMIVAQHSFGIPCDIDRIKLLASNKKIFLLEDCALTLGSKLNGTVVGNFGDAAIFSTDHSKPINTLIGGMVYTNDKKLSKSLRKSRDQYSELPLKKQQSLWKRFLIERVFCSNRKYYGRMFLVDLLYIFGIRFLGRIDPFLSDDFKSNNDRSSYPYPARLPSFLAQIGIYEVKMWGKKSNERKKFLSAFLSKFKKNKLAGNLPYAYFDPSKEIVPLRIAWHANNGEELREKFSKLINVDWTWFMKPVVATNEPLESYFYAYGSCPVSETFGPKMVNIPCNIKSNERSLLLSFIEKIAK